MMSIGYTSTTKPVPGDERKLSSRRSTVVTQAPQPSMKEDQSLYHSLGSVPIAESFSHRVLTSTKNRKVR